ncbi:aminoglycoside phosphotransferase family protein [Streptosporangiaceae bacterium NEAU-GS5]|nr:aminoglycoside phosphotransferase family protein [Streptosporangiaceae bacterium NEAU-GS5]
MTVDIAAGAPAALDAACREAGLSPSGALLLRNFANIVYLLPAESVVVRLTEAATPGRYERLVTSIRTTRWLAEQGFPAIQPIDVRQPIAAEGHFATFWSYERHEGPPPDPAALGIMLRLLHALPPVPFDLPTYDPFGSVRRAIGACRVLRDEERGWLLERCSALSDSYYERLSFALPYGLVHGDAHRGNLLRTSGRLVLCDWDSVSAGPREIDLIPTLQGGRFGLTECMRDRFADAYGFDPRDWFGFVIMRDIRELQTLTAVLRRAHLDEASRAELRLRLDSLRAGDDRTWNAF